MSFVNSAVTGPKFTKFLHIEVAISHCVSECQTDEKGEFAIFFTKLFAMATSFEISEKKRPIFIMYVQPIAPSEKIAKISPADPEIIVLQEIIKKEINLKCVAKPSV